MNKHYLYTPLLFTALLSFQTAALASENVNKQETAKPLILAIDSQNATSHFARTDTYTSQYKQNSLVKTSAKIDAISKTLKNVSRAFKRITSIRYGKGRKIRAKLGAKSLTLRYTYTL